MRRTLLPTIARSGAIIDTPKCREPANRFLPTVPDTHQSRAARSLPKNLSEGYFTPTFNYLPPLRTLAAAVGMALAHRSASRCSNFEPTQQPYTFRRTHMRIENLSKELDTETMSAVRGGDNGNSATTSSARR